MAAQHIKYTLLGELLTKVEKNPRATIFVLNFRLLISHFFRTFFSRVTQESSFPHARKLVRATLRISSLWPVTDTD